MFSIDLRGGLPIYKQLEKKITELISDGRLKTDDKLPSIREVANELCINPNTVNKVYAALEERNLIYTIPSKGFFVKSEENAVKILREQTLEKFRSVTEETLKSGISPQKMHDIIDIISEIEKNEKGDAKQV